jgi:opacity protein-like surface antigen
MLRAFLICLILSPQAFALTTEVGVSYAQKKTTFNQDNYITTEAITGSLSLYFYERIAAEFSYTEATGLREEMVMGNKQVTYQKTGILGADLILILLDRTSVIQPYIKGGVARITRKQEIKVANLDPIKIEPEPALVPSYGAGVKIAITPTFGIKLSYDVWKTPVGDGTTTDDSQIRAGVTFTL